MGLQKKNRFKDCLIIALFAAPAFLLCGFANTDGIVIKKPGGSLKVGEELTYSIKWLGATIGTCNAKVRGMERVGGRDAYVVELTARTNDFLTNIYPVKDTYISYVDKERFVTLKHVVSRREGRYKKDAVTIFDYNAKKAYFRNTLDNSQKTVDLPGYVQDPVSAVCYLRTLDLEIGERVEYKVYNNESIYDMIGVIAKKQYLKLGGKTYETFYVEPYAKLQGEVVKKGRASCYLSCDPLRIPVYGIVKGPIFTKVTAVLIDKKGGSK